MKLIRCVLEALEELKLEKTDMKTVGISLIIVGGVVLLVASA